MAPVDRLVLGGHGVEVCELLLRLLLQCCHSRHGAVAVPGKMVGLALEGLDLARLG